MAHRVAIVGGGYAGMAAAVALARKGAAVTVFESGAVPGGRARRVVAQGREVDNGQHILIGAYSVLLALVREVGVPPDALLRLPVELRYADGFALTARYGLLPGLMLARGIPFRQRLGALRFMRALRAPLPADMTVRVRSSRGSTRSLAPGAPANASRSTVRKTRAEACVTGVLSAETQSGSHR